jgi:hypothetical protein
LPAPQVAVSAPDVTIGQGAVNFGDKTGQDARQFVIEKDYACFWYRGIGAFEIREGRWVTYDASDGASASDLVAYIVGNVLGAVLYQRGATVLHSSSVCIGRAGVCFAGRSGSGKSSLVAALIARGHTLVSDDVTAVWHTEDLFYITPGFRQIRLAPQTMIAVHPPVHTLSLAHEGVFKTVYHVPTSTIADRVPLKRIYILAAGPEVANTRVTGRNAWLACAMNMYIGRRNTKDAGDLWLYQQLADHVDVRILSYPRCLGRLPDLAQLVELDVGEA